MLVHVFRTILTTAAELLRHCMRTGKIVGIAGASGSGKTFAARNIMESLGPGEAVTIQEDSYYKNLSDLPYDQRVATNFDHPGAFDHGLLAEHLQQLLRGKAVSRPVYDYRRHCRSEETETVEPCGLIIVEGILILSDARLRERMDLRIFVDTALDMCLIRRLKRDIAERGRTTDSVLKQYAETVRPMYLQFVEPSRQYADILISGEGKNPEAADIAIARIKALLLDHHE